jgi:ABC-type Fe3+ transport system permease subunit
MNLKTDRVVRAFRWTVGLLAALWIPDLAFAQNCALCYSQAAGGGSRLIQALRSGILILVIPPMAICVGIAVMAYRKRNTFNEE